MSAVHAVTAWRAQELQGFLAVDLGLARTGVAVGNRITRAPSPLPTLSTHGKGARESALDAVIAHWQPDAIVVGVPTHPDGQPHDMTRSAQRLARSLAQRHRKPVFEVDERYSSAEAKQSGASDLDAAAACIILQRFFDEHLDALHVQTPIPTPQGNPPT